MILGYWFGVKDNRSSIVTIAGKVSKIANLREMMTLCIGSFQPFPIWYDSIFKRFCITQRVTHACLS
jgi:hypothetical protein